MNSLKNQLPAITLLCSWLLLPVCEAHAYIDPGSGSFIIQVIIAGLVSAGVAVKMFWRNIKGFFTRGSSKRDSQDSDD